ncbi:MAG TPA: hypothetical protein VN282_25790 [Pyrinomonadaceae bacterium]|nr:hypothetical protein [Pyrinomonadaceae bacterium]
MRKTFSALVLVLALGATVFAGDIPSPPAPTSGNSTSKPSASEETSPTPGASDSADYQTADLLAEAALTVLDSVLALF